MPIGGVGCHGTRRFLVRSAHPTFLRHSGWCTRVEGNRKGKPAPIPTDGHVRVSSDYLNLMVYKIFLSGGFPAQVCVPMAME